MIGIFEQFVTLWVVIDPIGTIPVFVAVTAGLQAQVGSRDAHPGPNFEPEARLGADIRSLKRFFAAWFSERGPRKGTRERAGCLE